MSKLQPGFIIIENALPSNIHDALHELLSQEYQDQVAAGLVDPNGLDAHAAGAHCTGYSQSNNLQTHRAVQQLLTNARVSTAKGLVDS
eukprot:SAG11_NODE_1773_length_4272_cov_6.865085_4_plen_88_part_00